MRIDLSGHHVDVTDSLKQYVNEKMRRLERHFDHVTDTHVVLTVEKTRHRAEATVRLGGNKIFADSTQGDMYAAIDALVDKLDRQMIKRKEKHAAERRRAPKPSRVADV